MQEKPVFQHFLKISALVFTDSCTEMRFCSGQNIAESGFKKDFFLSENTGNMPEIAIFAHFHWTFSVYFLFFSHKIQLITTFPIFCKNCRNSRLSCRKNGFSSISRVLLNISFMNFCSILAVDPYSFARSFVRFSVSFPLMSMFSLFV